ncbi:MAG TPA: hypothetical protein VMV40_10005 [Acidiferrobacter sp.]|nr:hypothetical protein [Acidiferrobacter sp.]
MWLRAARALAFGALAAAYPFVSYRANASGRPGVLGLAFAFLPVLALLLGLAWNAKSRRFWLAVFGGACLGLWYSKNLFLAHYSWAFLAEDVGTLALLCAVFARTLRAGGTPLISRLSTLIHGPLTPLVLRYTRNVTILWATVFGFLAGLSLLLFLLAPRPSWALFANVVTPLVMASVFVGEYLVRRHVLPRDQCTGFMQVVRASREHWRTIVEAEASAVPSSQAPQ